MTDSEKLSKLADRLERAIDTFSSMYWTNSHEIADLRRIAARLEELESELAQAAERYERLKDHIEPFVGGSHD